MAISTIGRKYGWRRDIPDFRDFFFNLEPINEELLLPKVDLRDSFMPEVWDQEAEGCCTGHGLAAAIAYDENKQKLTYFMPSRNFIYALERIEEGTPLTDDSGAQIRDGASVLAKYGVCREDLWQYNSDTFSKIPSAEAYEDAKLHLITKYSRVNQDLNSIKHALASGYLIVFGISVFESFESGEVAKTGDVPTPSSNEECLGGHCIDLVGYDNSLGNGKFFFRNSWGTHWGNNGYGTLDYAYVTNPQLSSDFWVIQTIASYT